MKLVHSLAAAAIAAAFAPAAGAATFTVTTLADGGAGSLRDAIAQANVAPGADSIVFAPGVAGVLVLSGGELVVSDAVTIGGPGAGIVTIDANGASRAFHLTNPQAADLSYAIGGFTVTGGAINDGSNDSGAGMYYQADSIHATIALTNMVFDGNAAGRNGGAVAVSGANLALTNVYMINNVVEGGFQPSGGALYFSRGTIRMDHVRVIGNSAELNAGGIRLSSPGVNAVIVDTLVQGNTSTHTGGGMLADTMTSLFISRSAFIDNTTGQPNGGGLYFSGVTDAGSAENVIENTTFSNNASLHQFGRGSALAVNQGNLTVRNSTFAFNKTAPNDAPGNDAGGALWVNVGATTKVKLISTLFAGNTHGNAGQEIDVTRSIVASGTQSTIDADHSSFETTPAIGVISGVNTANLFEVDPGLLPLTLDEGGFTPVHPLPRDSRVVDAGANPANLATDQRGPGFSRGFSEDGQHRPDIGAYEVRGDTIFWGDFETH